MSGEKNGLSHTSAADLDDLRNAVGRQLLELIKRYETGAFKDQHGNPKPVPASLLAQAIKFLNDNDLNGSGAE